MKLNVVLLCAFLIFAFTVICKADSEQSITVKSGETLVISDSQEKQNVHIESGGNLVIESNAVLKILPEGTITISSEANLTVKAAGKLFVCKEAMLNNAGKITNRGIIITDYDEDEE